MRVGRRRSHMRGLRWIITGVVVVVAGGVVAGVVGVDVAVVVVVGVGALVVVVVGAGAAVVVVVVVVTGGTMLMGMGTMTRLLVNNSIGLGAPK